MLQFEIFSFPFPTFPPIPEPPCSYPTLSPQLPVVTARKALILFSLIHWVSSLSDGKVSKGFLITWPYTIRLTFFVIWDTR